MLEKRREVMDENAGKDMSSFGYELRSINTMIISGTFFARLLDFPAHENLKSILRDSRGADSIDASAFSWLHCITSSTLASS